MTPKVVAARAYVAAGFPVLLLQWVNKDGSCACGNPQCESAGKHPLAGLVPHGLKDATKDLAKVEGWWTEYPEANIGLLTGAASGLVVVDSDPRHGGGRSLAELVRKEGELPSGHAVAKTGGGGTHRYFAHPGGNVPSVNGLRPGLDFKADDAYVVAPVSRTKRAYTWSVPLLGARLPLPPPWLLKAADRGSPKAGGPVDATPEGRPIQNGSRNIELTRIAGRLRRAGAGHRAILIQLREVNAARCRPRLEEDELEKIASSIARYPPGTQREANSGRPRPVPISVERVREESI